MVGVICLYLSMLLGSKILQITIGYVVQKQSSNSSSLDTMPLAIPGFGMV